MNSRAIGQHGFQITRLFLVNCFLVRSDANERELIAVDTAIPGTALRLLHTATDLGGKIVAVVLTHGHGDHAGSADSLVKALGNDVPLFIGEAESSYVGYGPQSLTPAKPPLLKNFTQLKSKASRLLKDGERVGPFEVVFTPGHTPGQIALFDQRDRTVYCGDVFTNVRELAVSGVLQPWFPFPAFATWNKQQAIESAERLRDLNPQRLVLGHGPPVEDPRPAMERAIAEAKRQLEKA
jgi:glyoxylase-like metal-dependent hydrolase (beta-lactamase superfamily II)